MSLRHLYKLTYVNDGGTGEDSVLVTQESMTDAYADKFGVNAKADAPNAPKTSKVDTTKIDVKIGVLKRCIVAILLS